MWLYNWDQKERGNKSLSQRNRKIYDELILWDRKYEKAERMIQMNIVRKITG